LKHYLLLYDVVESFADKRGAFRGSHLEKAWRAHERGELVLAGALADPVDGAVLGHAGLQRGDRRQAFHRPGRHRDGEELRGCALDEAMAGKPVTTASSAPYGCSVKYAI
jgi:hypothetical protein